MKNIDKKDTIDEDIMIFWSLAKLERYLKQDDKSERRCRQRFRIYTSKPPKHNGKIKTVKYEPY